MARVSKAVQDVTIAGITPAYTTPTADGISIQNDGNVWLHVKATGAETVVTIQVPGKSRDGLEITDPTVTVPATTGDKKFRLPHPSDANQGDGTTYVDFSVQAGVSVAALRLPR